MLSSKILALARCPEQVPDVAGVGDQSTEKDDPAAEQWAWDPKQSGQPVLGWPRVVMAVLCRDQSQLLEYCSGWEMSQNSVLA